jgi:WD40 repeat protein
VTRLFLSYGRGDDEPFVAQLHADLTARGFDVWFDRVSMPSRNLTFHQEIRDAIAARERLLLVVGPCATTSDYVRQEWQFAYFEAEKVVTPILRLGEYPLAIDELKLVQCEDFRDNTSYTFHLDQLVRILRDPPPPLGRLIAVPSLPAHFLSRTDGLTKLRDDLLADLHLPVVISGPAARVGLHGMGGIGKSVMAAALARDRSVRAAFPDGIVWIGCGSVPDPYARLQDVLRVLGGGDAASATEHQGRETLKALLRDKAVLLVLDDVWRRSDVDVFDVLGSRCRALITTRDAGLLISLGSVQQVVELLTDDEAQRLLAVAGGVESTALPTDAHDVLAECGRLPLAVAIAGSMARSGTPWGDLRDSLREHELEFLEDAHAASDQHTNLWRTIEVSVRSLTGDTQQRLAELAVFPGDEQVRQAAVTTLWQGTGNLSPRQSRKLIIELKQRSLVLISHSEDTAADCIGSVMLHDLIHDYCMRLSRKYFGDERALHTRLLDAYIRKCPKGWWAGPNDGYFLNHLRNHLIMSGRVGELADLLHDLRWLEAKNAAGLAFDLPHDYSAAIGALDAKDGRHRILSLLGEALWRDIHFIARHADDYPQGLFQCLWNSCWWYDSAEAMDHFIEPDEGWIERPPWLQPKPKLCRLLEKWRRLKEEASGRFVWIRSLRPLEVHLDAAQHRDFRGHNDGVTSVAWAADGKRIASASHDHTVRVWDVRTSMIVRSLDGPKHSVVSIAWSPDGHSIVGGSWPCTVWVWDVQSGKVTKTIRRRTYDVTGVAYSPDGKWLARRSANAFSQRGELTVWDARSGREILRVNAKGDGSTVAFSPDSAQVVLAGLGDETVRVLDVSTGQEAVRVKGSAGVVHDVAFNPVKSLLACAGWAGTVEVWDTLKRRLAFQREGLPGSVETVTFSPDGNLLAIGWGFGTLEVWDLSESQLIFFRKAHTGPVNSITFSPDCRQLASGSEDHSVKVWDISGPPAAMLVQKGHTRRINGVAFGANGEYLVSTSDDETARVWNPFNGKEVHSLEGFGLGIKIPEFTRDGRCFAAATAGPGKLGTSDVKIWESRTGQECASLDGHASFINALAFSPDGHQLASAGGYRNQPGEIFVWNAMDGQQLMALNGHRGAVRGLAYSNSGNRLASVSNDGTVKIWDLDGQRAILTMVGHEHRVSSVAFSPNDRFVASGSYDKTVRIWNAATGDECHCLSGHQALVSKLKFSPDSMCLASCDGWDVRVWDVKSGNCLQLHRGKSDLAAIALGPGKTPYLAFLRDLEVVIETSATGQAIGWFPAGPGSIACHPSGKIWAGCTGNYLYLFALEGIARPSSPSQ